MFVTAYQHRSAHRSLEALIQLWGLEVRRVWQPGGDEDGHEDEDGAGTSSGLTVDVVEIVLASRSISRCNLKHDRL